MNNKPNIVLFVADQMRCDSMHHMGNDASVTPHLDSILEEGISFNILGSSSCLCK